MKIKRDCHLLYESVVALPVSLILSNSPGSLVRGFMLPLGNCLLVFFLLFFLLGTIESTSVSCAFAGLGHRKTAPMIQRIHASGIRTVFTSVSKRGMQRLRRPPSQRRSIVARGLPALPNYPRVLGYRMYRGRTDLLLIVPP